MITTRMICAVALLTVCVGTATAKGYSLTSPDGKTTVSVSDGSSVIASFTMPPYSYNNGTILLSTPSMSNGSSYTLNLGSTTQTATASSSISSSMGGGSMPGGGGGRPGG